MWNAGTAEITTMLVIVNRNLGSARSAERLVTKRSFVRYCDRRNPHHEEQMKKKNSKRKGGGSRRAPRKQVRTVRIANAALEANPHRMYVNAVVNNCAIRFLLDTGSDITLLNEKTWKKMGSPSLEKTNVVVKNASGDQMKVFGKLRCKIEMKGIKTEGYAYVTPYNSLMGLEWIRGNEEMAYHMDMILSE
ncbi:hypothetical protein TELCIR_25873, partial [Teladorsagia circumcincta]